MLVRLVSQTFELAPSLYKFVVGQCKGGHWEHPDCNGTSFARDRLVDPVARMMFSFHGIDCSCLCDGNIILRRDKESIWGCFGESILLFFAAFLFFVLQLLLLYTFVKRRRRRRRSTRYSTKTLLPWEPLSLQPLHRSSQAFGGGAAPSPPTLSGLFQAKPKPCLIPQDRSAPSQPQKSSKKHSSRIIKATIPRINLHSPPINNISLVYVVWSLWQGFHSFATVETHLCNVRDFCSHDYQVFPCSSLGIVLAPALRFFAPCCYQ